jgi:hypothetical protein
MRRVNAMSTEVLDNGFLPKLNSDYITLEYTDSAI